MKPPTYLIAKYIPDLSRMEPRNIGVVAWANGDLAARFIGQKTQQASEVDGRSIPSFVTDSYAYRQWIGFWVEETSGKTICDLRSGKEFSAEEPDCLMALKETGRDNFILEDGGFLLDELPAGETVSDLANYLFETLVSQETHLLTFAKDAALQEASERILTRSGLPETKGFISDYRIKRKVGKFEDELKFSHAFMNGSLSLFQKVTLSKNHETLEKNVQSTAWKFEQAAKLESLDPSHEFSLIYAAEDRLGDPSVERAVSLLEEVSTVVNLCSQEDEFLERLLELRNHANLS